MGDIDLFWFRQYQIQHPSIGDRLNFSPGVSPDKICQAKQRKLFKTTA